MMVDRIEAEDIPVIDAYIMSIFSDGERAQNVLENLGMFEQVGKQFILTADINVINEFIKLRPDEEVSDGKENT